VSSGGGFPPIRKDFEGMQTDILDRITQVERRRSGGRPATTWDTLSGKPFATITWGGATARWVRVARIDGVNASNGAFMTLAYGGGGGFGDINAQDSGRIHFGQRGADIVTLTVIHDTTTPTAITTFYTRKISTYVYELWAALPAYNLPLGVQVLSAFPSTSVLTMDQVAGTAPSSLVAATEDVVLQTNGFNLGSVAESRTPNSFPLGYSHGFGDAFFPTTVGTIEVVRQSDVRAVQRCWEKGDSVEQRWWYRSALNGTTWGPWILAGGDTGWVDLSSYYAAGGTGAFEGRIRGSLVELRGSPTLDIVNSTGAVELWDAIPAIYRPSTRNAWGSFYSGAGYTSAIVLRIDGTGAVANRTGANWTTTGQFTLIFNKG
jgi:hypothetical protein